MSMSGVHKLLSILDFQMYANRATERVRFAGKMILNKILVPSIAARVSVEMS